LVQLIVDELVSVLPHILTPQLRNRRLADGPLNYANLIGWTWGPRPRFTVLSVICH